MRERGHNHRVSTPEGVGHRARPLFKRPGLGQVQLLSRPLSCTTPSRANYIGKGKGVFDLLMNPLTIIASCTARLVGRGSRDGRS